MLSFLWLICVLNVMHNNSIILFSFFFFFNDTATTEIYTLSLHDALPISVCFRRCFAECGRSPPNLGLDRKSTRLNSSHVSISYAVFCLKKKKKHNTNHAVKTNNKNLVMQGKRTTST